MVVAGTAFLRLGTGTPVGICGAVTLAVAVVLCGLSGASDGGRGALAALFGLGARAERGLSGAVSLAVAIVLGGLARAKNGPGGKTGVELNRGLRRWCEGLAARFGLGATAEGWTLGAVIAAVAIVLGELARAKNAPSGKT